MKIVPIVFGLMLLSISAYAQNPVLQSGSVTKGHAAKWSAQGVIQDAGPASGGNANVGITDLPVLGTGTPLCIYDAPKSGNAAGYHSLCLGANDNSKGLINFTSGGAATPLPLQLCANGQCFDFPFVGSGSGNVIGSPPTTMGSIAFWNNTSGTLLNERGFVYNGTYLTAPTNSGFVVNGTGTFQVGGPTGPMILNDTAMDTVSVQAKPGALPSTDTTNFQLYPPEPGGKVFLNLTSLASLSPPGEQRLIIGSLGATNNYIFSQVIAGTGVCRDVLFMDGIEPAWTLRCGVAGGKPALQLGFDISLMGSHTTYGPQGLLQLQNNVNANLIVGAGANIKAIDFANPIGSTAPAVTLSSCGTSPSIVGANMTKGLVVVGTGATICTVNFTRTYTSTPAITLTGVDTLGLVIYLTSVSGSGFAFTANGTAMSGAKVMYHVIQ